MATPEQISARTSRRPLGAAGALRAPVALATACTVAIVAGCHADHVSFCASFSSGTGTHVTVTDDHFHCPSRHHAVAVEAEGHGRFDGREAGLGEGSAAGRAEGFTIGVLDARDGVVAHPAVPACCLAPSPWRSVTPDPPPDGGAERSPTYIDAYRQGYREAFDEAFEEGFGDGYAEGYAEGYGFGAR